MGAEFLAEGEGRIEIRIPKLEIRRNSESKIPNKFRRCSRFCIRVLGFVRASDFGFRSLRRIVCQLHDVVEVIVVPTNLQDVDQAFMRAGDGFEFLNAAEFALERAAVFKIFAIDNFDGAACS